MANIEVHKIAPAARTSWEPLRWVRNLLHKDPFAEVAPAPPVEESTAFFPAFEVKETPEAFAIKADLPGVKPEDVEVSLAANRLMIRGKREAEKEEKGDAFYVIERDYGAFMRSFMMPDGVDVEHIRADLKDGVLALVLPKKPEVLPKKIDVNL
jgi:HSP20 family protein